MKFKIGSDPEVFLVNKYTQDFVSAAGMLPGTKHEPFRIEKGAVQVDGVAFEANIDPAETEEEFNKNLETVLNQMKEMVQAVDKDLEIKFTPFAKFDKKYFQLLAPEAKILGCDPDFDYNGDMKEPPALQDVPIRTAAGHIHIGWTEGVDPLHPVHMEDCKFLSKRTYVSGLFAPQTKEEKMRLRFYGGDGAFRPKSYGVELRAPSNIWVATEEGRRNMFNKIKTVMEVIN